MSLRNMQSLNEQEMLVMRSAGPDDRLASRPLVVTEMMTVESSGQSLYKVHKTQSIVCSNSRHPGTPLRSR